MKEKTYRVPQNVWFMIKLAWTSGEKKVLVLGLLSALLAVALNLARLYISPAVLAVLEKQASLTELLKTIGGSLCRCKYAAWPCHCPPGDHESSEPESSDDFLS